LRSFASELLSAAVVLTVPTCIVAVFPFDALEFRASEGVTQPVRNAFVRLTPESERLALRSARTSWQEKGVGVRRLQTDIFRVELPEEEPMSVLSVRDRSRPPGMSRIACERTAFLPSLKAPPPILIKSGKMPEALAFPREELLKMN